MAEYLKTMSMSWIANANRCLFTISGRLEIGVTTKFKNSQGVKIRAIIPASYHCWPNRNVNNAGATQKNIPNKGKPISNIRIKVFRTKALKSSPLLNIAVACG